MIDPELNDLRREQEARFYGDHVDNIFIPGPDVSYYGDWIVNVKTAVEIALDEEREGRFGTRDPSGW